MEKKDYNYSLDDLALPYSEKLIPPEEVGNVGMLTSIGCYGNCSFCSYNRGGISFRFHSINNIIKELDYIAQYNNSEDVTIRFFDECFSVNSIRTLDILLEISKRKYKFKYWCCLRYDILNERIINFLYICNFRDIVIGFESASEEIISKLGKLKNSTNPKQF